MNLAHLMVIDPAVRKPELEAFNWFSRRFAIPVTYHLPALFGMKSIEADEGGAIKGIVILGSLSSVNERLSWQIALETWLKPRLEKKIPALGICYGHQMLAYMFGGKVGYSSPDKKKHVGLREIELSSDRLWGGKELKGKICVSHNEIVTHAPKEMDVIGKSALVAIDALRHKDLPIWSFQSHPEANTEFLASRGGSEVKDEELRFGYELLGYFLEYVKK